MTTINRASGLRITVPPSYSVAEPAAPAGPQRRATRGRAFGPVPLPADPVARATANDAVVAAFGNQEMQLVDQVELAPAPAASVTTRRHGARAAPANNTAEFALTVAPYEDAVVLLEQDGMYSWQFASEATTEAARPMKRRAPAAGPQRLVKFSITLPAEAAPKRRSAKRGIIGTSFSISSKRSSLSSRPASPSVTQ